MLETIDKMHFFSLQIKIYRDRIRDGIKAKIKFKILHFYARTPFAVALYYEFECLVKAKESGILSLTYP